MELHTPTILGGNSYVSWFYDRGGGGGKKRSITHRSKGISQPMNSGPMKKFLPKHANVHVTIQSHGHSPGARTHYAIANEFMN